MELARQLYPQESVEIRITAGDRHAELSVGPGHEPGQWAELITPSYRSFATKVSAEAAPTSTEKRHARAFGSTEAKALSELATVLESKLPVAAQASENPKAAPASNAGVQRPHAIK
jgi:hypothetical protein